MSPNTVASGVANPIWNNVTPDTLLIAYETGILTRKVLKIPCTATVASTAPAAILAPPENGAAATAKEYIPTAAIPETISPITSTATCNTHEG